MIYQCELCLRFTDAGAVVLEPQPPMKLVIPDLMVVCTGCQVSPPAPVEREPVRIVRPVAAVASRAVESGKAAKRMSGRAVAVSNHRGCPEEREFQYSVASVQCAEKAEVRADHRSAPPVVGGLSHGEHERAFRGSENAVNRDQKVFEELMRSFDLEHPERPGEWITGIYFLEKHQIKAANSCASRIRKWELLAKHELDVDSKFIGRSSSNEHEHWAYRICRKVDSERLQREEKRKRV